MFCYDKAMLRRNFVVFAWGLSLLVAILAVTAWHQSLLVPLDKLGIYDVFPLFGILAFSVMWSHYMVSALRAKLNFDREKLNTYYGVTVAVVLGAILLHPGLLVWQFWQDGGGWLVFNYVAPDLRLYVIIAEVAWLAFIAYELHRWYSDRSWWHWVERASDVAMLTILVHGYKMGQDILPGWFIALWYFFGATLIGAIVYSAKRRYEQTGNLL